MAGGGGGGGFAVTPAVGYAAEPDPAVAGAIFPSALSTGTPPAVPLGVGRLDDGTERGWSPGPLPAAALPCRFVRYFPPVDRPCQPLPIQPLLGQHAKLATLSGFTADV